MVAQTLRKASMFSGIPAASLNRLIEGCELVSVPKGKYLFHEGAVADGFYVVHRGGINVHRVTEDGKEQVIRVFYPAESFGEVVLVGDRTYPASAKASEDSQVILIPTGFFRQQIKRDPDLALSILGSMSLHLKYLVETIEDLKLRQAEYRVSQWILKQIHAQGLRGAEQPTMTLPCTKTVLASQLGITSETLSRVFAQMRKQQLIRVTGKTISLLDPGGIEAYAQAAG